MSKKHEREQKVLDRLQRENRELKQEIKSLRNSVRRLNKGFHRLADDDVIEEKEVPIEAKICYDCSVGHLQKVSILGRYWRQCNNCPKRTKTKRENP